MTYETRKLHSTDLSPCMPSETKVSEVHVLNRQTLSLVLIFIH